MRGKRLRAQISLCFILSPTERTLFLRKKKIYAALGEKSMIQGRAIPLYPELIRIGDNVHIASNVHFVTHDIAHIMLNNLPGGHFHYREKLGCIEIGNNVFIGAGTRILYDVRIGSNCIIGASSLVNKDIPDNSVAAGIPAKVICTFDEYLKKREADQNYPATLSPQNEEIPEELADWCWKRFREKRTE